MEPNVYDAMVLPGMAMVTWVFIEYFSNRAWLQGNRKGLFLFLFSVATGLLGHYLCGLNVVTAFLAAAGVLGAPGLNSLVRATPGAKKLKRNGALLVLLLLLSGCTTFRVSDPVTGKEVVSANGAIFMSRVDNIEVTHEWLDEATNTDHKTTIRRFADENADAQIQAMRILAETLAGLPAPVGRVVAP